MAYKALYNKYRPSTFEEVAGQRAIIRTLRNAIASEKIAHAYLFCGPRGTGKTSMARLFAKALNCEEGEGHQCNHCSNCLELMAGTHPDVVEIDAASNNGVDQVRDLIEQVHYLPIKGRYKVYIIDEVHMMSQGAFNALLKTLEEPPEHVIFILATTEPHKVLPTILSRCQRYDFGKIADEDIKNKLIWILQQENATYEEKGLDAVVSLSDGGMRDALSILDQVLAYGGNSLKEADVLQVFGLTSSATKVALLETVAHHDIPGVLAKEQEFLQGGVDIRRLTSDLLDILKDLLVYHRTKSGKYLASLRPEEAEKLDGLLTPSRVNFMIDALLKTQREFRNVANIRSLFELALLQMSSEEETAAAPTASMPSAPAAAAPAAPKPAQSPSTMPGVYTGTSAPSFFDEPDAKPASAASPAAPTAQAAPIPASGMTITGPGIVDKGTPIVISDEDLVKIMVLAAKCKEERRQLYFNKWKKLQDAALDPEKGAAAQLLCDCRAYCLTENVLVLSANFEALAQQVNLQENQMSLEETLLPILGRKVFVYALDRQAQVRVENLFHNLRQISQLPRIENIQLNLPKFGGK